MLRKLFAGVVLLLSLALAGFGGLGGDFGKLGSPRGAANFVSTTNPLTCSPCIYYNTFAAYADSATLNGTLPTGSGGVGGPMFTTGSDIPTTSGGFVQSAGTGYLYTYIPSIPTTVAVDFAISGGDGTQNPLAISFNDNPEGIQNMLHLNFGAHSFILSTYTSGTPTQILTGNWRKVHGNFPATDGTVYRVKLTLGASTATITGPSGETFSASTAGLPVHMGQSVFWEPATSGAAVAKVQRIYAIGPGTYFGPGDLASSWGAFYSLRAYSAATLGAKLIRACTASDAACSDLVSDATTGDLVTTGMACDGTDTIKTWYELTGTFASGDLTQATIANRAKLICASGGVRPYAQFNGSQCYATAGTLSLTRPTGMTAIASATVTGSALANAPGDTAIFFPAGVATVKFYWNNVNAALSYTSPNLASLQEAITANSSGSTVAINGTAGTLNGGNANLNAALNLGGDTNCTTDLITGKVLEAGFYGADFSGIYQKFTNQQRGWARF